VRWDQKQRERLVKAIGPKLIEKGRSSKCLNVGIRWLNFNSFDRGMQAAAI